MVPMSTTDYPDQLSAVLFCQGCSWRCHYCHNPHLLPIDVEKLINWESIIKLLEQRRNLLDAVVFSGGEPLLQQGLDSAIDEVRSMGFKVALHTAGSIPERFSRVLPKLDWVGFDIKGLPADCESITTIASSGNKSWQSLRLLLDSGVAHEVRITVHWSLTTPSQVIALGDRLAHEGVKTFVLQDCRNGSCLNPELGVSRIGADEFSRVRQHLENSIEHITFR